MKNKWKQAVVVLLFAVIMTGCDPMPVQETEAEENHHAEKIEINDSGTKRLTDEFWSDTNVLIRVDADVQRDISVVPDVGIAAREITVDEVKHWAKVFLGEQELYEEDGYRSWIETEQRVEWMQDRIADRTALLDAYGGDEEAVDALIDYYNQQIDQLLSDYYSEEGWSSQPMENWTFQENDYYWSESNYWLELGYMDSDDFADTRRMAFKGEINGKEADIAAVNDLKNKLCSLSFWQTDGLWTDLQNKRLLSKEDVIRLTDDKVYQLTGMEWHLVDTQNLGNMWRVTYVPFEEAVEDYQYYLEVSQVKYQLNSWNGDIDMPYMNYEHLIMDVRGDQIIAARYECPMEVEVTGNKQAELRPFDEIYEAFQDYIRTQDIRKNYKAEEDPWLEEDILKMVQDDNAYFDSLDAFIDVTSIKRGILQRKADAGQETGDDVYEYVPVWVFYGKAYLENETESLPYLRDDLLCAVNGLNGCIIGLEDE